MARVVRRLSMAVFLFAALLTQVGAQSYEDCHYFGVVTGQGCAVSSSPWYTCEDCVYNVCNEQFGGEYNNCAAWCRSGGYAVCGM